MFTKHTFRWNSVPFWHTGNRKIRLSGSIYRRLQIAGVHTGASCTLWCGVIFFNTRRLGVLSADIVSAECANSYLKWHLWKHLCFRQYSLSRRCVHDKWSRKHQEVKVDSKVKIIVFYIHGELWMTHDMALCQVLLAQWCCKWRVHMYVAIVCA